MVENNFPAEFRALRKHLLEFDKKLSWQTLTEAKLQRYCDSLIKGGMRTSTTRQ